MVNIIAWLSREKMKFFQLWFTIIGLIVISTKVTRAQLEASCPVFGTDQSSSLSRSTETRIFVNFESPSQCKGNVTSYRYCFYDSTPDEDADVVTYGARLMIYRRSSPTSDIYTAVPGSIRTLDLSHQVAGTSQCQDEVLSESFEIQENDVVGACVMSTEDIGPLHLVGDTNDNSANFKLYQLDRGGFEDCTSSQIGSVDTGLNNFRQRSDFILHVSANMGVIASCRVGANPPASAPRTSSLQGTYFNTANSVSCTDRNAITSWHYCYYTSAVTPGQTYTMTVAVWRLDTTTNTYRVTAGSTRTITLVPVATLARIFCMEETLNSADSVFVMVGDVIGVVLPSSNPIPVVSSDPSSSSSLMRHSQSASAADLLSSQLNSLTGTALHLYAILDVELPPITPVPTTPPPISSPLTTNPPHTTSAIPLTTNPPHTTSATTTEEDQTTTIEIVAETDEVELTSMQPLESTRDSGSATMSGYGRLSSEGIAAIIVSLLTVLVILTTVVVILAILYYHRKKDSYYNTPTIGDIGARQGTQNQVGAEDIEMTQNQVHKLGAEGKIEMTQNQVYGLRGEDQIEMTKNQGYGAFQSESSHEQSLTQTYAVIDDKTRPQSELYDYVDCL